MHSVPAINQMYNAKLLLRTFS